jgi:hypothetical protein
MQEMPETRSHHAATSSLGKDIAYVLTVELTMSCFMCRRPSADQVSMLLRSFRSQNVNPAKVLRNDGTQPAMVRLVVWHFPVHAQHAAWYTIRASAKEKLPISPD